MYSVAVLFAGGAVGGLLFLWLKLPGGAMVGSMIAVILCKTFATLPQTVIPSPLKTAAYIGVGVAIGSLYKPGMLAAVRDTWPVLFISTAILLGAGLISTYIVYKSGVLSPSGAYLATTPGGFNAIIGLAAEMGEDAPVVVVYQLVRVYVIAITAPFIGKFLHAVLR